MSEVIVTELAEVIGVSPERLIEQMAEAGVKGKKKDSSVTDEERQSLLAHLKRAHGESDEEDGQPKKISLKRKSTTQLKTGGSSRKTVNVEVRKTRTYVKRTEVEEETVAAVEPTPEVAPAAPVVEASAEKAVDSSPKAIKTPSIPTAAPKVAVVEEAKSDADKADDLRREQERSAAEKEAQTAADAAAKEHVAHESERLAAEASAQKKAKEDAARIAKEDEEEQRKWYRVDG